MTDAQIAAINTAFGLANAQFAAPHAGYRNISYAVKHEKQEYNLMIHKDEPGIVSQIKRTNSLGLALHQVGLPVRYPLDKRILVLRMGKVHYALLYNYLPGATIPWESFTMKHIKLLGWAMAHLHQAMAPLATAGFPVVYDEYRSILMRMDAYFGNALIAEAISGKLSVQFDRSVISHQEQFLAACDGLGSRQLLHMDLVRGNVLYDETSPRDLFKIDGIALTGIIDFEKAAIGHPLFDIARTLSFLLVDCSTKSQKKIYSYFLNSGYTKRGRLLVKVLSVSLSDGTKCDVLEMAIDLFLLYDFYKFLRSNPYESLGDNYHYVRTRDLLIKRGIVLQASPPS